MPSNSSFTCEYPTDWEEVPEVLEYHSNLDSLGYNISSTMRTMEMLTILHHNASSSQNDAEMDEDAETHKWIKLLLVMSIGKKYIRYKP